MLCFDRVSAQEINHSALVHHANISPSTLYTESVKSNFLDISPPRVILTALTITNGLTHRLLLRPA